MREAASWCVWLGQCRMDLWDPSSDKWPLTRLYFPFVHHLLYLLDNAQQGGSRQEAGRIMLSRCGSREDHELTKRRTLRWLSHISAHANFLKSCKKWARPSASSSARPPSTAQCEIKNIISRQSPRSAKCWWNYRAEGAAQCEIFGKFFGYRRKRKSAKRNVYLSRRVSNSVTKYVFNSLSN